MKKVCSTCDYGVEGICLKHNSEASDRGRCKEWKKRIPRYEISGRVIGKRITIDILDFRTKELKLSVSGKIRTF